MCVVTTAMAGSLAAAVAANSAIATVAAAGFSAYSSYQSGKSQQAVADYNAKVQEIQAQDARARGGFEANQKRKEVSAVLGQQQTQLAANGVETSSGTALTLASDTAWAGEMDAKTIEVNALRAAYGYEQEAVGTRLQGKAARRNANGQAIGSLLGGVSQAYNSYYGFKGTAE